MLKDVPFYNEGAVVEVRNLQKWDLDLMFLPKDFYVGFFIF